MERREVCRISIGSIAAVLEISPDAPSSLTETFLEILPFKAGLHYAKISGETLLFFVPFFVPPNNMIHVSKLTSGTIAYWPNRQMMLIYYGNVDKEDASVMVLGIVKKGLERLAKAGELVRIRQRETIEIRKGC